MTFSFDLKDQDARVTPVVSVIAAGNGSHALTGAASGYTDISVGNGANTAVLRGTNNTVTLGSGIDTIRGGSDDMINIVGNTAISDRSSGLQLNIGPTAGHVVLSGFASDPGGVVDLTGGVGGFTDTATVLSALAGDGRGGTVLSFGGGRLLDFVGVVPSQLHAANFQVG